jgi:septum formation protein
MLLRQIGFLFSVIPSHADESFPDDMPPSEVPALLAKRKAEAVFINHPDSIILASDTIVILGNTILNKPADREDAIRMLKMLSSATHTVITAVYLKGPGIAENFEDTSRVTFRKLNEKSIEKYVDEFKPYDKAGAYGAQECLPPGINPCSDEEIGFLSSIGKTTLVEKSLNSPESRVEVIEAISGSFFTVMGLPIHLVYRYLTPFHA